MSDRLLKDLKMKLFWPKFENGTCLAFGLSEMSMQSFAAGLKTLTQ